MNKNDLKMYVEDLLMLEVWDLNELKAGECKDKDLKEVWDGLRKESKDLIETYVFGYFYHSIAGYTFSKLFEKINNYKLRENDDDDYENTNGGIIFSGYDTLNINFDNVVTTIVEYEFMNN